MKTNNGKQIASELYDLIKINALPKKQDDEWAILSRKHAKEATAFFKKLLRNKNIEVSENKITIGKRITITIS